MPMTLQERLRVESLLGKAHHRMSLLRLLCDAADALDARDAEIEKLKAEASIVVNPYDVDECYPARLQEWDDE